MNSLVQITFLFFCIGNKVVMPQTNLAARKLLEELFKESLPNDVVPVDNNGVLNVHVGFSLIQVLEVDVTNELLRIIAKKTFEWHNALHIWEASKYNNLQYLHIDTRNIWLPDVVLKNSISSQTHTLSMQDTGQHDTVVMRHDGWVKRQVTNVEIIPCPMDLTRYPFDSQECSLKFASLAYDGGKVDVNLTSTQDMDTRDYVRSQAWTLVRHNAKKRVLYKTCCPEPYPELVFNMTLKRSSVQEQVSVVVTWLLLTVVSLSVLWIPPEHTLTKCVLGAVCLFFHLLGINYYSTYFRGRLILGEYVTLTAILVTVNLLVSVLTMNILATADRDTRLPEVIDKMLLKTMPGCVCGRKNLTSKTYGERKDRTKRKWMDFVTVIDRMLFIIELGIIAVAFMFMFI